MTNGSTQDRVDLEQARKSIAKIWYWGAGVSGCLVILQLILGRFEGITAEFIGWFTPTIVPTLGLIIGVISSTASEDDTDRTVKGFFFRTARGLSLVYLVVLFFTMLLEPFAGNHDMKYYNFANYWLAPIQGLVVAALGALFNSRKKTEG
jgi:cytochrome bd-type quinol oxidase subunit 2